MLATLTHLGGYAVELHPPPAAAFPVNAREESALCPNAADSRPWDPAAT